MYDDIKILICYVSSRIDQPSELPFNKLYGFLNHSFPNGTCQTGSTDSSCPELDVNLRTGECYLSSILLTIFAKQYLKVREYRESEKSNAIHPPNTLRGLLAAE